MNKHAVLFAAGIIGVLSLHAFLGPTGAWAKPNHPNIVFILVDDQPHDALGFMARYPFLETPHMDALARQGVHFQNAFVTTSLCSPSRASFISGQYAHTHGVRYNDGTDLPRAAPNVARQLQANGYTTAFFGKWHQAETDRPRPGFDHWTAFKGQGAYFNQRLNVNGQHIQTNGYITDVLTDRAVAYLKRKQQKPFSLFLWHKAVHAPFKPAPRHEDAFPSASLPEPESFSDPLEGKPRWLRRGLTYNGWQTQAWQQSAGRPVPRAIEPRAWNGKQERWLNQLRCLYAVDESLGRLLDTLRATGQYQNTVIVFSSDNGYLFGEHRRWDKRLAYEPSMRVPLLIQYPAGIDAGQTVKPMALNIDVPATLLDLAGVAPPEAMQGRSLVPLMRDGSPTTPWRSAFLYEYFAEPWWLPGVPTILAVRTNEWKYINYPYDPRQISELYQLTRDPHEMDNLLWPEERARALARMQRLMARQKRKTGYAPPQRHQPLDDAALLPLLHWRLQPVHEFRIADRTGHGHTGHLTGIPAERLAKQPLASLKQPGMVRLDKTPQALNPVGKPLTVSARVRGQAPSGVIFAFGGKQAGLALHVTKQKPVFVVRVHGKLWRVASTTPLPPNQWVHVAATLTSNKRLKLYVNGTLAATGQGQGLASHPHNGISVGGDPASPVGRYQAPNHWTGRIRDVRFFFGAAKASKIREWAREGAS
jgi:N-acetylglucosamine-6-sulfatase